MNEYRIEERDGGYEPQMKYTAGAIPGEFWFPLATTGYWLEPDAYSYGAIMKYNLLPTRAEAEAVIERAKRINDLRPIIGSVS